MNRDYLKNLYLQRLESERYSDVFRESMSSLVSTEIINAVISLAVQDDDETMLVDLLELFLQNLESNVVFHEKLTKSSFHLLLFKRPLGIQSYTKLKSIYDRVGSRRVVPGFEHTEFLSKNFYNYCLYKHAYKDYQFDLELDAGSLGPVETNLFKDLLKAVCIENRENEHLANYIKTLPMDVSVFLAIVMPDFRIDASRLGPEDVFLVCPSQVRGYDPKQFTKAFLCSLNSEGGLCRVCGRRVLGCGFEEIDHEEYLDSVSGNIEEMCFGVSHWEKIRTPRMLTTILRSLFKRPGCLECYKCLRYFPIEEQGEMEDIVLRFLRYAASILSIGNIQVSLRMFPFIRHTPRVVFSYFVILFEGFLKYSGNLFLKNVIRNVSTRNKAKFMGVRAMIFEHYLKGSIESASSTEENTKNEGGSGAVENPGRKRADDLGDLFAPLSEFFDEERKAFVRNNMFYIYPIMYSLSFPYYTPDLAFTQANNHFLIISLFLRGEESRIDEIGYGKDELYRMGVDVMIPLLCNGYFKYDVLSRFFGNVQEYIRAHLPKFLFALKKVYVERPFEFRICVFKILKCIIEAISGNVRMLFNYLFPFVEFFMRSHEESCGTDCKMIFIEYYSSFFKNDCLVRNMSRIFPYLDAEKIARWSNVKSEDDYLDIVIGLLDTRGHFSQEMAAKKAVELLARVFGDPGKGKGFDEESFVENVLRRFFKSREFRMKIGNVYGKLKELGNDAAFLIGCISQEFLDANPLPSVCSVLIEECTPEAIARVMVEKYLFEMDPGKQDLHFFIIQETLRFIKGPLSDRMEEVVEQFRSTQYFYEYVPVHPVEGVYEKTYTFKRFLGRLYRYSLNEIAKSEMQEYFSLLKYGNLLDTLFLEFHCLCLCRLLLEAGDHKVLGMVREIANNLQEGVDKRIARFVLKLHGFTSGKHIEDQQILRISFFLKDHHNAIQTLEKMIRKERKSELFDLLQYCYYSIKDYDKVLGINSVFARPSLINLFFRFCVDKNFAAARRCLEPKPGHDGVKEESGEDHKGQAPRELDVRILMEEIIDECQDDEVTKFMNDCKKIEGDFSEWKRLESRNEVFKHFIKDCELVSKSKNLLKTLDLIAGRRELAGDNRMLLECHESLVASIRSMMDARDDMSCDEMFESLLTAEKQDTIGNSSQGLHSREYFDDFASVDMVRAERRSERIGYMDRSKSGSTSGYSSLEEFERDLKLAIIRNYRGDDDVGRCIQEIGGMLLKREWCVLYELAELNVLQGKIGDAKTSLKKVLEIFPKTSMLYKKALIRYSELLDTKTAYTSALSILKDSGKLFLLGAKKFESTEPVKAMEMYINSVIHDNQCSDEAVPRIFHLFSEMMPPGDINAGAVLLKKFLESSISLLPPYYNQILSRLSHPNQDVANVVSRIVFELMENYPSKTFWRSLIMMNSQVPSTRKRMEGIVSGLTLDNKVALSNVKRISEELTCISRSKKNELTMEEDFPAFAKMFPAGVTVPNTKVLISGVRNEVKVFNSLQRPKRICFVGSDGKNYYWLCKNQDDLRKDSRFMDLNLIINSILKKQSSRKYIRTYAVIPFSHESGIIEWIGGLSSLKAICDTYYARDGISISETACRFVHNKKIGMREWHRVASKFHPKFHLWFHDSFPHPFSWLVARNNYTQTYAIMNIVGWFMGLGDRHAENILFDSNTGDTVHVDLNCIFGKGKELQVPERVPYRLTQNIVDAFGVLGLEGSYNTSLCTTLDLFLKNKNILVSNLLSFVYDPLFEWRRKSATTPKKIIEDLWHKMDDLDACSKCDVLNEEATNDENLCMMYIGWLPFI